MKNFEEYTKQRLETVEKDIVTVHLGENDIAIAIYADSLMETSRYDYYVIENYSSNPTVLMYNWFDDLSNMDAIIRESLAIHLLLLGFDSLNEKDIKLEEDIFSGTSPIKELYDKESLAKVSSLVSNPSAITYAVSRLGVLCEGFKDETLANKAKDYTEK